MDWIFVEMHNWTGLRQVFFLYLFQMLIFNVEIDIAAHLFCLYRAFRAILDYLSENIEWIIESQAFYVWFGSSPTPSPFKLTEGWGGEEGAKLFDRKKAWSPINHSILSSIYYPTLCVSSLPISPSINHSIISAPYTIHLCMFHSCLFRLL